ncbi:MAG: hypothetical protein COS88_04450 [Chloroflexi bacterium CG07_land_8_20_14_0_80_51_10]|nr:MAG: hypothetical protein COS88_04450 [Chloroflexi bacterium CG07_land_8_20_14_0_80_51_10]
MVSSNLILVEIEGLDIGEHGAKAYPNFHYDVGRTLNAIVKGARIGEVGDGKIFVLPVENAVRVRTGDAGNDAI